MVPVACGAYALLVTFNRDSAQAGLSRRVAKTFLALCILGVPAGLMGHLAAPPGPRRIMGRWARRDGAANRSQNEDPACGRGVLQSDRAAASQYLAGYVFGRHRAARRIRPSSRGIPELAFRIHILCAATDHRAGRSVGARRRAARSPPGTLSHPTRSRRACSRFPSSSMTTHSGGIRCPAARETRGLSGATGWQGSTPLPLATSADRWC